LALAANVGDTLVRVPVIGFGESLVDAVVEVLVVGENDVATNIVELQTPTALEHQRFFQKWIYQARHHLRNLQGSRLSMPDRRESRWSPESSMTGRPETNC
jgi:hypothetical protein